jgi:hypothetical protein
MTTQSACTSSILQLWVAPFLGLNSMVMQNMVITAWYQGWEINSIPLEPPFSSFHVTKAFSAELDAARTKPLSAKLMDLKKAERASARTAGPPEVAVSRCNSGAYAKPGALRDSRCAGQPQFGELVQSIDKELETTMLSTLLFHNRNNGQHVPSLLSQKRAAQAMART